MTAATAHGWVQPGSEYPIYLSISRASASLCINAEQDMQSHRRPRGSERGVTTCPHQSISWYFARAREWYKTRESKSASRKEGGRKMGSMYVWDTDQKIPEHCQLIYLNKNAALWTVVVTSAAK
eukprot:6186142-Pleurochrysis_carterae.AAC.4